MEDGELTQDTIGQRSDGAITLLAIDGRTTESLGASHGVGYYQLLFNLKSIHFSKLITVLNFIIKEELKSKVNETVQKYVL